MTGKDTQYAAFAATLRAAAIVAALALLTCAAGCGPQIASVAPIAAMAASKTMESTASTASSGSSDDKPTREQCNQLLEAPPRIEQVKLDAGGKIESREIRLDESGSYPQWVVYRNKNSDPEGWRLQPHLAQLHFAPSLESTLSRDDPRFLAYAVMIPKTPEETNQMTSMAETFAAQVGTFKWQNRVYDYTLVKDLPCFSGPE